MAFPNTENLLFLRVHKKLTSKNSRYLSSNSWVVLKGLQAAARMREQTAYHHLLKQQTPSMADKRMHPTQLKTRHTYMHSHKRPRKETARSSSS